MPKVLFETPGHWWLPENEERRVPGMLRIDADGRIEVRLFETLDECATDFGSPAIRPVLRGELHTSPVAGGSLITHLGAFAVRRSLHSNGTTSETLVANRSYVGDEHLVSADQEFRRYSVGFTGLGNWLPLSAFTRKASRGTVRIEVGKPAELSASVEGTAVTFVKSAEVTFSEDEMAIRSSARARFEMAVSRTPDDFAREWLVPLRYLLTLARGVIAHTECVDIVLGGERPWPDEMHDLEIWSRAKVHPPRAAVHRFDALIAPPRDDLELQSLLDRWWAVWKRLRRPAERVFALWEAPPKFADVRVLAVFDAFSLLTQSIGGPSDPGAALGALGATVGRELPPLGELVDRLSRSVAALRANEETDPKELFRLSEVFDWLMRFVLMNELGVDMERASRSPGFRHAASRLEQD